MTSVQKLLVAVIILLAANLAVQVIHPGQTVQIVPTANAQPVLASTATPGRIYTSSPDGGTLYVWEDNGSGWKSKSYR